MYGSMASLHLVRGETFLRATTCCRLATIRYCRHSRKSTDRLHRRCTLFERQQWNVTQSRYEQKSKFSEFAWLVLFSPGFLCSCSWCYLFCSLLHNRKHTPKRKKGESKRDKYCVL